MLSLASLIADKPNLLLAGRPVRILGSGRSFPFLIFITALTILFIIVAIILVLIILAFTTFIVGLLQERGFKLQWSSQ